MNFIHYKKISLVCVLFFMAITTSSAQYKITLDYKDAPLKTVIESIEKQIGKSFFFEDNLFDPKSTVSINLQNADLGAVIEKLFNGTVTFLQIEQHIVLQKAQPAETAAPATTKGNAAPTSASKTTQNVEKISQSGTRVQTTRTIRGTVLDDTGLPLPGAVIQLKGNTKKHTTTDANGKFQMDNVNSDATLVVSFLGYMTEEVSLRGRATVEITLKSDVVRLEEVVVIGNIERRKESFTGATTTVSGEALKQIGTQNLVMNLQSLDPSFVVLDNNIVGANPNVMPNIEIRGQTSINIEDVESTYKTDPNQPLFILDGFETSLQKIVDLDFNRVASVTILKDAASTAMYGSRAANGVVVVETIKGKPGRYKIFYTGDYSVQVPDLNSYNMMNASEKLQFEWLSGYYDYQNDRSKIESSIGAMAQAKLDALYSQRLAEVQRGVDTYWLSEPVQTAFINRQSIRVSGGSNEMIVDAGLSYRNAPGVMKGSKRDSWSGNVNLTYNKSQFRIVNYFDVSGYKGVESPYGSFSDYVRANPYFRKTDEYGGYPRFLAEVAPNGIPGLNPYSVPNPLYNAMLNSRNDSKNLAVNNNFQAIWHLFSGMQLQGSLQIGTERTQSILFTPPENTLYDGYANNKKGYYYGSNYDALNYQGRLMYLWQNTIKKHNYTINLQGEIGSTEFETSAMEAEGFPYGTNGNPSFATSYREGAVPEFVSNVSRRVSFLASGNYSFNNRYLFDASYRLDGSTVFGSSKKYKPFWGVGIGWNVHEENFIKNISWLSLLRLRANMGVVGNQNIGGILSTNIYAYLPGASIFGTGVIRSQLGNPDIDWQQTLTKNITLNVNLLEDRFVSEFSVYEKYTDPLVPNIDQAPSTGTPSYAISMGNLTVKGFEFSVSYAFIRNIDRKINWNVKVFGSIFESTYGGFSDQLEKMNAAARNSNRMNRYRDGYSSYDLWAVKSLGIDPSTGQEVFLDKNGHPSFVYNAGEEIVVGNSNPDIYGTISTFLQFKQLTFSTILRYSLGGDIFNSALYNKVENISYGQVGYNQDKRALYERWQKPGDVTQFKAISLSTSTPMSSRFVQTENYLSGESISLGWRFERNTWVRHLGMEQLNLNASMNNFFRLSNVRSERGTTYPFARTFSLSVNAIF